MATYYVSPTGNDSSDGLTTGTAWATLTKVNSATLAANDTILFQRNGVWYGQLIPQRSTINYSAYGSGNRPVISGFQVLSSWQDMGGGIFRAATTTTNPKVLVIDDIIIPKGRYPKTDWSRFDSHSGLTSITDSDLPASPDLTGAEVVIKTSRFSIETRTITAHSTNTLTFAAVEHALQDNFGYFIQNHTSCLTQLGDWYYTAGYIYMYFGAVVPSTKVVKVSLYDYVLKCQNRTDINTQIICFEGGYESNVYSNVNCTNFIVDNIESKLCGRYGVTSVATGLKVLNSTIHHCADFGIYTYSTSAEISGNAIDSIGLWEGMGTYTGYMGISVNGNTSITEYNRITNCGYNGIILRGNDSQVRYNFVDTYCTVLDDGGGIYTSNNTYTGRVIDHNICINGIGNYTGSTNYGSTTPSTTLYAHGIYLDEMAADVDVTNNSCINNSYSGIFLHSATSNNVTGNTAFNNAFTQLLFAHDTTAANMASIVNANNIFVAKEATQYCFYFRSNYDDLNFGSASGNVYARPVDDDNVFGVDPYNGGLTAYDLAGWKTLSGYDADSTKSPKTITDVNDISIVYNDTNTAEAVSLGSAKMGMDGTIYVSEITLQPFTSAILINHSSNIKYLIDNAGKYLVGSDGKYQYTSI